MEAIRFIQPNVLSSTGADFNTTVPAAEDANADHQLEGAAAPALDSLTITSTNLVVARLVLTQQIDIALEIKSPVPVNIFSESDSQSLSSDAFSQGLANKVVQKMAQDDSSRNNHHTSEGHHHDNSVKTVSMQVAQGFEQATVVINQLGIHDEAVAGDIAQSRAQVDQAIDQEAVRPATVVDDSPNPGIESGVIYSSSTYRELNTSVQITTQEGDIVTIDFTRIQELTAASASGTNNSVSYLGFSSSTQIDFSVQGDLNKKERESIGNVIDQVTKLAEKVARGKTGAAMERLSHFRIDTRQLTGVTLNMSSIITQQAVAAYTQVSRIPVGDSTTTQVTDQGSAESNPVPVASSNTDNTPDQTNRAAVDPSSAPQVPVEPDTTIATHVMQDLARVVHGAHAAGSFENPFKEISKLFAKAFDILSFDNDQFTNRHKDFVKELFGDLLKKLEHNHRKKHDPVRHVLKSLV